MNESKPKFFHTINANGQIDKQGMILWANPSSVTVQLFSWIDGRPTNRQTFERQAMNTWRFYESKAEWLKAGANVFA